MVILLRLIEQRTDYGYNMFIKLKLDSRNRLLNHKAFLHINKDQKRENKKINKKTNKNTQADYNSKQIKQFKEKYDKKATLICLLYHFRPEFFIYLFNGSSILSNFPKSKKKKKVKNNILFFPPYLIQSHLSK